MALDMDSNIAVLDGSILSFHNLSYAVKLGGRCRKKTEKTILKGITGCFEPGLNAILGPTGSGKTSLLDILAGRKGKTGISGEVLINGNDLPRNFKCRSAYVVQDDVVMGTLTVRENLAFSAALRLPDSISRKEKRDRVDDIINELGLQDCKDSKVGTVFIRGVSGGERKRTNIGMELIIKPSVLYLDEPTTGLDASTAFSVISLLAQLSKRGRNIILSIHQPRFTIFKLFDKLHLLSKGETVYHGPAQESLDFFSSVGYECEAHNNPPDFFLDVIIKDNASQGSEDSEDGVSNSEVHRALEEGKVAELNNMEAKKGSLADSFKKSRFYLAAEERSAEILKLHENKAVSEDVSEIYYATGFFTQVAVVSKRAAMNYRRNFQISIFPLVMAAFFAIVIGLVYSGADMSFPSGTQNRTGAMLFCSIFMLFSNMAAMETFIEERKVFIHESSSGFYRTSSYFIAKAICDMLPMRLFPTTIFSVIFYWIFGFKADAGAFFIFLLTMILTTFCGTGLVFLVSIKIGIISVATALISAVNILMFIYGGVIVNTRSIPDWIAWLKYLSIVRYSVNALSINEFRGLEFCRANSTFCITGEEYLEDLDIGTSDWDLFQNHVALACFMVALLTLGYIALLKVPRSK